MLLALALVGCGYEPPDVPRGPEPWAVDPAWTQARDIVWSFYGETDEAPWLATLGPEKLNCATDANGLWVTVERDGGGWWASSDDPASSTPECVVGVYMHTLDIVEVALYADAKPSGDLPHELWHAHLRRHGIADAQHQDPGFAHGGMVDRASEMLARMGL